MTVHLDLERVDVLISEASQGNEAAWIAIVDRYSSLVWAICRSFRLDATDAADVAQTVWLRTVERLSTLREPNALPGWLATVTRRECLAVVRASARSSVPWGTLEREPTADVDSTALDAALLANERDTILREAFSQLPEQCRQLLHLLTEDEPTPYAEISALLGIPIGSIGPTRARCLAKLRRSPAVSEWMTAHDGEGSVG